MSTSKELEDHVFSAYFSLRAGAILATVLLPIVLGFGGMLRGTVPAVLSSLSDYYWSGDALLRDWFVGTLFAVGVFLVAYKGFSPLENYALNVAGVSAWLTALNPCACGDRSRVTIHGFTAVLFFLTMAFVCFACAPETLELTNNETIKRRFTRRYRALSAALVASPAAAVLINLFPGMPKGWTFTFETFGLFVFATYWGVKSYEFKLTNAEKQALQGRLARIKGSGVVRSELMRPEDRRGALVN